MLTLELLLILAVVVHTTIAVLHGSPRSLVMASTLFVTVIYVYKTYGTLYEESMLTWEAGRVEVATPHGSAATAGHTDRQGKPWAPSHTLTSPSL